MEQHGCGSKKCKRPDDEDMVACERCRKWWHHDCADFEPDKFDTATPWFCTNTDCEPPPDGDENVSLKGDNVQPGDNDGGISVDLLIEAASVAQAVVAQKDNELQALRKEMDEMRLQLAKVTSIKEQPALVVSKDSKPEVDRNRLKLIKKIQENHNSLVENVQHKQSTPLRNVGFAAPPQMESSFRDADMANLLTILNRNNVQELPSFSGADKREWPYFEEVYKSTTVEGRYSGKENVSRLRKALVGEAYQLVSDRLKYSSDADAIMDSLRAVFGRHDVLVHDLTAGLLNLPRLSSKCDPKLRLWAVKLNGFVADIKSLKMDEDLDNGYVITCLGCKLGASLYQDWVRRKSVHSRANLEDFAKFLTEKVVDLPPELLSHTDGTDARRAANRVLTHKPVVPSDSSVVCVRCGQKHSLIQCSEFKDLSETQRLQFVKDKGICFSCLDPVKHNWRVCRQRSTCGIRRCSGRHHPLLHPSEENNNSELNSAASPFVPAQHVHSSHVGTDSSILFKIAPIRIHGSNAKFVDTYAFLDDGSSLSMVEKDLFDELGLTGVSESLILQWTKGVSRHEDSFRTSLAVSAVNNRKRLQLKNVYTVKNLELPSQSIDVAEMKRAYPHLRGLPLMDLVNAKPKILVGLDQAKFLWGHGQRHGKDEEPCAIKTLLGWVVYGKSAPAFNVSCLNQAAKPTMHLLFHDAVKTEDDLHELVKHHFSTEDFGVKTPVGDLVSQEVARAVDVMQRTLRRVDNHYEIGLLWNSDGVSLPDSYPMALSRLKGLEKSLKKRPQLLEWKNKHMRELVSKGYARIASTEELEKPWARVWYAPTFIIENPNKLSPKPRDVADVAAKVNGVSLNTFLLKGPDNLVALHAGLFKFRERAIAVNADVKEMFHRIRIKEDDQQCQRILWRDGDSGREPSVYIMEVMMFGPRCSPTCAQFIKNHHAEKYRLECPEAVDGLTQRTYVDDYFNSHDTVDKAIAVTKDAIRICKTMNFDLVGIQSNSQDFLQNIPDSHINAKLVSVDPGDCDTIISKILGMYWLPHSDQFTYKILRNETLEKMLLPDSKITKREILKMVMQIFDPLGLISYYIIRGRITLQEVWREGFDWDEPVSEEIKIPWIDFIRELRNIEKLTIPRRYLSWNPDDSEVSLVVFVDASELAFAAVAYLRFENDNKVEVVLVMAKAKVAPVKKLSVPKLELQAAVLGVRLADTVKHSHSIRLHNCFYLSDSATVLSWINSTKFKFPSFVAVRVGEILDSTTPRQWYHVRTKDNVADDATRWKDSSVGGTDSRWFKGPEFLGAPISSWPITPGKSTVSSAIPENPEPMNVALHETQVLASYSIYDELKPRFRSSWSSSVRVIALLLRFKDILRKVRVEKFAFVTPVEYTRAENWLFRKVQTEAFPEDIAALRSRKEVVTSSKITNFSPFLDEEGTIRMSSRGQKALVSYAARNPAILPKTHPLVDIFIMHHHVKNLHVGTSSVISGIRERAWIISVRVAVDRVKSRCNMCKRLKARPVMPLMGQLPEARIAFHKRPFTHVGVDCFGPLLVKYGRGTVKRYGMIFTCLTFRAVQIELLNDLSLDQCTMAVRRFIINRVVTRYLYSDNGLNFVGTKNQLDKDTREMEAALGEYASKYEGILWRFIPAYSPWMGGAWERLIQSIKHSIEFILRGTIPREDVLRNALLEAQGQINTRPLTHIPVDPEDPKPLTPNSMLFGEDYQDVTAPGVFCERDACNKLYSRRAQHLMAQFVKRWYSEYLPEITRRSKWHQNTKPVEEGNLVLIIDPNEIRSSWQLGRVTKVYPGPDGVVRTADVQVANGSIKLRRSVGRLAVLDLSSS